MGDAAGMIGTAGTEEPRSAGRTDSGARATSDSGTDSGAMKEAVSTVDGVTTGDPTGGVGEGRISLCGPCKGWRHWGQQRWKGWAAQLGP